VVEQEMVGNAHDGNTATAKEGVAQSILALSTDMRVAVQFEGNAHRRAEEVGEVGPHGKLAAEAKTVELPSPKQLPEALFGDGGMVAMLTG
jgi:hypothetical protein